LSKSYDHLFRNIKSHAVSGIKIFTSRDDFLIRQNFEAVSGEDHTIWSRLFRKLEKPLEQYASKEYLDGILELDLPRNNFPRFSVLNKRIKLRGNWKLVPVAGFLDEYIFFEMNARREFPVTDIIRQSKRFAEKYSGVNIENEDGYTPEPDIFHDVRGHGPFLMDQAYGDFMVAIGELGLGIINDEAGRGPGLVAHNLRRLQNFAWWTYEFGIMAKQPQTDKSRKVVNDSDHEIYGAGIISSFDEVMNVVRCSRGESQASKLLPFDIEEVTLMCFDYSAIQDRYYVIESMEILYQEFYDNQELFNYEG
jgi:phenylalanine-4-hydroxylase